jgi:formate hydrogenlyase transcriptional activator
VFGEQGAPIQPLNLPPEETPTWWLYQHQVPLIIPSLDAETRFPAILAVLKKRGIRSLCALPLTTVHRRLGMLAVGSMETDAYSKEEVSFLSLVANQVALAVDDALNFDASQHAEEALRASEESFRLIVDSIPAFAWYASPDGKIEYLNQRILDFTAERQENLVGFGWANVLHPDDVEATKKAWLHSVETGEPCEVDQRVRRFDNIYRWFRTNAQPLRDTSGRVIRWYGVATEIEDRKRGAEDLRRSEAYLTQAQKLSQTGSFGWHLSSGEIYWSEETFRIFGYEPAPKATIEMVVERTHPEDRPVVQALIERVSRTLKPFDFEHRLLLPDGSIKHVRVIGQPSKYVSGSFEFVGAVTDITERKRAELLLRESEQQFRAIFNEAGSGITLVDLVSGAPIENNRALQTMLGCSRDDLSRLETYDELTSRENREADAVLYRELSSGNRETLREEKHFVRRDGRSVWANVIFTLLRDSEGRPRHVIAIHEDITERKQAEEKLKRSEASLAEAQRLSRSGSWSWNVRTREGYWSQEMFRILGFDPENTKPALSQFLERVHRDDRPVVEQIVQQEMSGSCDDIVSDYRIVLPDKTVKHLHAIAHPMTNDSGEVVEVIGTSMDVTEQVEARNKLENALRQTHLLKEQFQRALDTIPGLVWSALPDGSVDYLNQPWLEYTGLSFEEAVGSGWQLAIHPEDLAGLIDYWKSVLESGKPGEREARLRRFDGVYRWFLFRAVPLFDGIGRLVKWYGQTTDIDDRKLAEERIRQDERELRQIVDTVAQLVVFLSPDGRSLYANRYTLEYTGLSIEDVQAESFRERVFHPEDVERLREERRMALLRGIPFENEQRARRKDGQYRWFFIRYNALLDEQGRPVRWYAAGIDIEDRKRAEERMRGENVALREEIDKASMFEEIVGTSAALKTVLSRVTKVAPTDSTVLITGETGAGKELIARAVHKRSRRSSRAFISVNCAVIPRDLIASELFGHEKGSFTGATQRRVGRFELAEGGTIFLDEVGDLPAQTQVALLRVLQEHEFERVGGNRSIQTDVRVIAATNRDLEAAIAAGVFRRDLFYRLNVFPIEIPSLRERQDDIPLLVEYFINRFARQFGKKIRGVNQKTMRLLQSYPWPGNIRELQNVIERSVIVCETEYLSVDESWLVLQPSGSDTRSDLKLSQELADQEKEIIEAALRETGGRVSGSSGAAAKLGIHRSTLESKIQSLKIDKYRFKSADTSKNS